MGMHHGIIAATTSLERMLVELRGQAGRFEPDEPLDSPYDALDGDLAIGERDGRCYVLDNRSTPLSDYPDMVHRMSVELGLVVAAGADTMFGAYWFTAARDGELLRYVYVNAESLTQGMAMGPELPSEAQHPIDGDWDGIGLFAAMVCLDVDPRPWLETGPVQLLIFDRTRYPEPGEIEQTRAQHIRRYGRPDSNWPSEFIAFTRD